MGVCIFVVSYLHKPEVSSEACSPPFVSFLTRFQSMTPYFTKPPIPKPVNGENMPCRYFLVSV